MWVRVPPSALNSSTVRRIDMHPELKKELLAWRDQRPKGQFVICDRKSLEPIQKDRANCKRARPDFPSLALFKLCGSTADQSSGEDGIRTRGGV